MTNVKRVNKIVSEREERYVFINTYLFIYMCVSIKRHGLLFNLCKTEECKFTKL